MQNKDYKNFFEDLEELLAIHLGLPINRNVDRVTKIDNEGKLKEDIFININVQPFVSTDKINISINLDQDNNLLNKF